MRGAPRVQSLFLILIAVGLSGCADQAPPPATPEVDEDGVLHTDPETGQETVLVPYDVRFAEASAVRHEETEDGTFALGEHWDLNGEFQDNAGVDAGSLHLRDVTDKIPKDVPVRLTAVLRSDMTQGDLDVWFDIPQEEVWAADFDTPRGGSSTVAYTLVHTSDDPIRLAVFYDEPEPAQEVRYEVTYSITAAPDLLLPGVPVTVPLPRDAAALEVRFDNGSASVWSWDPDDTFLGVSAPAAVVNLTFAGGMAGGAYVVLLPEGAPPARLRAYLPADDAQRSRSIAYGLTTQDIQRTDPVAIQVNQPAEGSFELTDVPVQVGLQVNVEEFTHGLTATLSSPETTLIDVSLQGTTPFVAPGPDATAGFTFLTDVGAEGVTSGSYTATFSGAPHGDGEMWLWVVQYAR